MGSVFMVPAAASLKSTSVTFSMDDDEVVSAYTSTLSGSEAKPKVYNYSSSDKALRFYLQWSDGDGWKSKYTTTVSVGSVVTTDEYIEGEQSSDLWRIYVCPTASLLPKTINGKAVLYTQ